jgi:hypothetical protein
VEKRHSISHREKGSSKKRIRKEERPKVFAKGTTSVEYRGRKARGKQLRKESMGNYRQKSRHRCECGSSYGECREKLSKEIEDCEVIEREREACEGVRGDNYRQFGKR